MNKTSFQGSTYTYKQDTQIHGTSGLKIMDGEDLTYGDRKRLQQLQSEQWWRQQMQQKQRNNNLKKNQKQIFDEQTLQITEYRKQMEQEKEKRLRDMEIAYTQDNFQQLNQKLNRNQFDRKNADDEGKHHIDYLLNNDFYTQNPDTCQSQLGKNRVLPYHWKGMNDKQRKQILEEQEKQRGQKNLQDQLQKEEDRLFAEQMEAQRKAVILEDRAKNKGIKNLRRGMDEYNRLKAEQMKKKAFEAYVRTQTYKNQ